MDTYLIVQEEAAERFIGKPLAEKETQSSVLIKPWFELIIFYRFKKSDFFPKPRVNVVMLQIKKRDKRLVEEARRSLYQDFIVYAFNQWKPTIKESLQKVFSNPQLLKGKVPLNAKPSELEIQHWIVLFDLFLREVTSQKQKLIEGAYKRLTLQQRGLKKIHRTRVAKGWNKISN